MAMLLLKGLCQHRQTLPLCLLCLLKLFHSKNSTRRQVLRCSMWVLLVPIGTLLFILLWLASVYPYLHKSLRPDIFPVQSASEGCGGDKFLVVFQLHWLRRRSLHNRRKIQVHCKMPRKLPNFRKKVSYISPASHTFFMQCIKSHDLFV